MRITQSLISNVVRQGADRAAQALLEAQRPVYDGTSLGAASIDPARADRVALIDRFDAELARHDASRNTVHGSLSNTEIAMQGIHDAIVEAQDLALQLGTDTVSPEVRRAGAATVRGLLDQIVALVNRPDESGIYPFTGTADGAPALSAARTYQGNDAARMVEVAPGVTVAATVAGRDVLGNDELVATFDALASALASGDADLVRATFDDLESSRSRVSSTIQDVGGRMAILDDLGDLTLSLRTSAQIERESLTGVDISTVGPAVQSAQTLLEAVISTSQSLMAQIGRGWFS